MNSIEQHRARITEIDTHIVALLAQRFSCVRAIGLAKKEQGTPVLDLKREDALRDIYSELAQQHGLDASFVMRYLDIVLAESKRIQRQGT